MNRHVNMMRECPNCGSVMDLHNFLYVCAYCGHTILSADYKQIYPHDFDINGCHKRVLYIQKKLDVIMRSPFVSMNIDEGCIIVKNLYNYYANDGRYNLIKEWALQMVYIVDKESENLIMRILSPVKQADTFVMLLNREYAIIPTFIEHSGNEYLFAMTPDEFSLVCRCNVCELSVNIGDERIDFGEFVHYCRRFYNVVFDGSIYSYSQNKKLLTDILIN